MPRVPIRVQQAPRFLLQAAQRALLSARREPPDVTFHLCFFTCRSYFKYLYCSLHSVARIKGDTRLRVHIFSDENDPLTDDQIALLRTLEPGLSARHWPRSQGWGTVQIANIWRAYALVASEAHPGDYIARVDSDVFFFSDWIFPLVAKSGKDLVGDGHFVGFGYCQGGLYFVRAAAVTRVVKLLEEKTMPDLLDEDGLRVEDRAIYQLVDRAGGTRWLVWFMMFPDELRIAGRLDGYNRLKFACLHFVMKNKDKMLEAYVREVLPREDVPAFQRAIGIETGPA
jgi:hypothetical protein